MRSENAGEFASSRYREIVKERYLISKHTNTSYEGTRDITPVERGYLLQFIMDDLQRQKEMYDKARAETTNKNK